MITGGIAGYTSGRYENGTFIIDASSRNFVREKKLVDDISIRETEKAKELIRNMCERLDKFNFYEYKSQPGFKMALTPETAGKVYCNYTPDPNLVDNNNMRPDFPYIIEGYRSDGTAIKRRELSYDYQKDLSNHNRYIYDVSTDFIKKAGEKYALLEGEQYYLKPPIFDYNFVDAVNGFFYDNKASYYDMNPLRAELDAAAHEMADNIKNGRSTNVADLKSTITILGKELTFADFKDIQAKSKAIASGASLQCGTDNVMFFAKDGLTKAMGIQYGKSLGGEFGEVYAAEFARGVDATYQQMVEASKTGEGSDKKYMVLPTTYGMKAFDLFEKVGTSYSFSTAMEKFDHLIDDYNRAWGGGVTAHTRSYYKNELNKIYNRV